jgi:hypothetical protein
MQYNKSVNSTQLSNIIQCRTLCNRRKETLKHYATKEKRWSDENVFGDGVVAKPTNLGNKYLI